MWGSLRGEGWRCGFDARVLTSASQTQVADLKAARLPENKDIHTLLLDPAVHREFLRLQVNCRYITTLRRPGGCCSCRSQAEHQTCRSQATLLEHFTTCIVSSPTRDG